MYKIVNRRKLWATRLVDGVGKLLFLPRLLLRKSKPIEPGSVRDILLIRTAYIGDVVMTLPMLKPLRQRFPAARLSFLTAPAAAPLLAGSPYVDEVLTFGPRWFYPAARDGYWRFIRGLRQKRFDLVIEARADIRELLAFVAPLKARHKVSYDVGGGGYLLTHVVPYPGLKHKVEYHLDMARFLGCEVAYPLDWGLRLTEAERHAGERMLEERGIAKPFLCVHPGGRLLLKRWPVDRYAALCDRLAAQFNWPVVVLGAADEEELAARLMAGMRARAVSLAGKLTMRELGGLLGGAALFICNDSGPMHLAAAMGTPTVAIFGPSKSDETGPYGDRNKAVEAAMPCRRTCDENSCRHSEFHACMNSVSVDDVLAAVRSVCRDG